MTQTDQFRDIKVLFGTLDDLNQERRKLYTEWGTGKMAPPAFGVEMTENLRRTREAASAMEKLLSGGG
ncbi:MAG TPA: hypothetical protein VGK94_09710 [Candidatus Polarisedimenticolia bacterium]|jgi:hypothetical protein